MDTIWIKLNTIQTLRQFVKDCSGLDAELEVVSGELTADAKSLLGLMTLPLSGPLELRILNQEHPVMPEILEKYRF